MIENKLCFDKEGLAAYPNDAFPVAPRPALGEVAFVKLNRWLPMPG